MEKVVARVTTDTNEQVVEYEKTSEVQLFIMDVKEGVYTENKPENISEVLTNERGMYQEAVLFGIS